MKNKIVYSVIGVLLVLGAFAVWVLSYQELSQQKTPSGDKRCESLYITMRDGIDIAVDRWLPPDYESGDRIPALIQMTRYSRYGYSGYRRMSFMQKLQARLGILPAWLLLEGGLEQESRRLCDAGYAVVHVDARGSAASFGTRPIEWSPDERMDLYDIVEWIISQEWSDGSVGAWGSSYPGNTAELLASVGHPAVRAVAPESSDFDPLLGIGMPGGVLTEAFITKWSSGNALYDSDPSRSIAVDSDRSGKRLAAAFESHDSCNIEEAIRAVEFVDDEWGGSGCTLGQVSPFSLKEEIESGGAAMLVRGGWLDAGVAAGALSRYLTLANPQHVVLGPWGHGRGPSLDPLLGDVVTVGETKEEIYDFYQMFLQAKLEQNEDLVAFFDRHMKSPGNLPAVRRIDYYTLGTGKWRSTETWPPEGLEDRSYYFAGDNRLTDTPSTERDPADTYIVDDTASTGENNRWMTQIGAWPAYAGDRREEDEKLLVYDSLPMARDMEITGSAVATVFLDSSLSDIALIVYLEDVAPDGKVTYLTEGLLRGIHQKTSDREPPYAHPGPYHSFLREDADPIEPGTVEKLEFFLYPTSAVIRKGHSIRIAVAGHDASVFIRHPAVGVPTWQIFRSEASPSHVVIPMKEYEEEP